MERNERYFFFYRPTIYQFQRIMYRCYNFSCSKFEENMIKKKKEKKKKKEG